MKSRDYHTFLVGYTSTQSRVGVVEGTGAEAVVLGSAVVHGLDWTST